VRSRVGWGGMSVGTKVILPVVALVLALSLLVSWFATQALSSSVAAATAAEAARQQDTLGADIASMEQRQATQLRNVAGTPGLPGATRSGTVPRLINPVLFPYVAGQLPDPLLVVVLDARGLELAHVAASADSPQCKCTAGRNLLAWPHVKDVLAGRADASGTTFSGVADDLDGPILYTIGPVKEGAKIVGALLVGEPLAYIVAQARALSRFDVTLYDLHGRLLAGTADIPVPANAGRIVHQQMSYGGRPVLVSAFPWRVHEVAAGHALVMVPADASGSAQRNLPLLLVAVFAGALALAIMVGSFISQTLTRPLGRLVRATEEVASGHLGHRVPITSADEIGRLTGSFNLMTESLEQSAAKIEASTEATLQTLAAAIDARDPYTHGHSMRVMRYSVELGRAMGLDSTQVEMIRRGCMVHDIGKIGVRDSILGKPARLTEGEEAQMRLHPMIGHSMLRHLGWEPDVLDIVLHHHERWDGNGYPGRLEGDEIPALARVVAIADTLDAMTSDRPYRKAHSFTHAATEIRRISGQQFDPAAVSAFNRASERLEQMVGELAPSAVVEPGDLAALLEVMSV
jgi:putative nucleotidyltransferase with HDIG domain